MRRRAVAGWSSPGILSRPRTSTSNFKSRGGSPSSVSNSTASGDISPFAARISEKGIRISRSTRQRAHHVISLSPVLSLTLTALARLYLPPVTRTSMSPGVEASTTNEMPILRWRRRFVRRRSAVSVAGSLSSSSMELVSDDFASRSARFSRFFLRATSDFSRFSEAAVSAAVSEFPLFSKLGAPACSAAVCSSSA